MKTSGSNIFWNIYFHSAIFRSEKKNFVDCLFKVGIAIKPNTAVEAVAEYVSLIDMVLIMTVREREGAQRERERERA